MNQPRNVLVPTLFVVALAGRSTANDTLYTAAAQSPRSGTTLIRIGDVDADGRPDLAEADGIVVRWISSASGSIVRSVPVGAFNGDSIALADAGDLDGDGVSDLAVGWGGARAYSGATGQLIWQVQSSSLGYGHALARIADRDGDGRPEILVGVPEMIVWGGGDVVHTSYEGDGRVEALSGASGALLATVTPPAGSTRGFGGSIAVLDDYDNDGVAEIAIAPFYQPSSIPGPFGATGAVRIVSGATLATLQAIPAPPDRSTRVTALGDFDGDGFDEFALTRIWESVEIVSYAAGTTVRAHGSQTAYDRVGQAVLALDDLDGDGRPDYAIGSPQPAQSGPFGTTIDSGPGFVRAHSGATGAVIWTLAGADPYGKFGWSLAAPGDLDGDQVPDIAVSSPQASRVAAVSGSTHNSAPNAYCVGGVLTGTQRARLLHTGTTSVAANDLSLVATDALPGQSGLFVYARSASMSTFGAGWRCIGTPFFRLGPAVAVGAGGSATRALDLTASPASGGAGAITVGTTACFQFLFRDLLPNHGGRNASSALAVTFGP